MSANIVDDYLSQCYLQAYCNCAVDEIWRLIHRDCAGCNVAFNYDDRFKHDLCYLLTPKEKVNKFWTVILSSSFIGEQAKEKWRLDIQYDEQCSKGDIARFLKRYNWDLQGELSRNTDWQAVLKNLLSTSLNKIKQFYVSNNLGKYYLLENSNFSQNDLLEEKKLLLENVLNEIVASFVGRQTFKCVQCDCVGGCDDETILHYGVGGNISQRKHPVCSLYTIEERIQFYWDDVIGKALVSPDIFEEWVDEVDKIPEKFLCKPDFLKLIINGNFVVNALLSFNNNVLNTDFVNFATDKYVKFQSKYYPKL